MPVAHAVSPRLQGRARGGVYTGRCFAQEAVLFAGAAQEFQRLLPKPERWAIQQSTNTSVQDVALDNAKFPWNNRMRNVSDRGSGL
jgi:hypothetical protein